MKFIGTWEHQDFVKQEADTEANSFYYQICLYEGDDLYHTQFGPDKSTYAECTFYDF
ncbi:hypothetical protein ACWGOQ_0003040 [Aquimarina sp. M1]